MRLKVVRYGEAIYDYGITATIPGTQYLIQRCLRLDRSWQGRNSGDTILNSTDAEKPLSYLDLRWHVRIPGTQRIPGTPNSGDTIINSRKRQKALSYLVSHWHDRPAWLSRLLMLSAGRGSFRTSALPPPSTSNLTGKPERHADVARLSCLSEDLKVARMVAFNGTLENFGQNSGLWNQGASRWSTQP